MNFQLFSYLSLDKKIEYLFDNDYKYIAEGTGRVVFDYNDDCVIKVSKNENGYRQNRVECKVKNKICAKVYKRCDDYTWLLMEKTSGISESLFDKINGNKVGQRYLYYDYLYYKNVGYNKLEREYKIGLTKPVVDYMDRSPITPYIKELIRRYKLSGSDLSKNISWGLNSKNELRLIDYGMDHDIFVEYFKDRNEKIYNIKFE